MYLPLCNVALRIRNDVRIRRISIWTESERL